MKKYILSIDQGTTSTKVLIVDEDLCIQSSQTTEVLPEYPREAWVDHDLEKVWKSSLQTIEKALKEAGSPSISAIGITNQRETSCAWDKKTLAPLGKAIVWQCRRTTPWCEKLKQQGLEDTVRKRTGLVLDPYFSGSKMGWMLENLSEVQDAHKRGTLAFGTIDSFLLSRLTSGAVHKTDVTNASRTSLMDIQNLSWCPEMLELFNIPPSTLPEICSSSQVYGKTKGLGVLPDGIPIAGILGDQQAALFGQLCTQPGETKITYGTGCFLLLNTGEKPFFSKNGLLTTVAWKIGSQTHYALEGSAFMGGATIQWLRDNLGIIKDVSEVEALALSAKEEDMGSLAFVPGMTGLGAPHWDPNARGLICGITRNTNKNHLARAALAGIAHQNDELLAAMRADYHAPLHSIKVDGGAAANNYLLQLQCDLVGIPLIRPKILETTALGSSLAAGLAIGIWSSLEELKGVWQLDKKFIPSMAEEERQRQKNRWNIAVQRCRL